MKKQILIAVLLMTSFLSCDRQKVTQGEDFMASLREVKSVNGDVIYQYVDDTIAAVYKREYMSNDLEYRVSINKDTLRLGDKFIGEVISYDSKKKIVIDVEAPEAESFESQGKRQALTFFYSPADTGHFFFRGKILADTSKFNFEYKFIVLPR